MMVRTYGRRSRGDVAGGTYSDSLEDDFVSDQETQSQDFLNFSLASQESSSLWPSSTFDPDPYSFSNGVVSKESKKPKLERPAYSRTLMETQEFGEMMEHVDEVNFALDGLRKGQPLRIRRGSLLSLLSICGTPQQRRLFRAQGMAKTIIDAIMGLSFDDFSSNVAAAALFYVLTGDGQEDHLLESPSCIRFLIKLLKPIISATAENKARSIGNKLLGFRKDSDILRDSSKLAHSSSTAIVAKVQEILVSCKDMKLNGADSGLDRPELSAKWISLLIMEKACLSKISLEDTSGTARKMGGNFKEKLREQGGLDAVFEVAMNCHCVIESWSKHGLPLNKDQKLGLECLMLLLKCLKIMENATFLSKENQIHLLELKGEVDFHCSQFSFAKLTISIIKILSGLYVLKTSSSSSFDGKPSSVSDGTDRASDMLSSVDYNVESNELVPLSSSPHCCGEESISACGVSVSQRSTTRLRLPAGMSESTTLMDDACPLKVRVRSSMSSSCSDTPTNYSNGSSLISTDLKKRFGLVERSTLRKDSTCELLEDSQDPFAFDEDEFLPSKWELLHGRPKKSRNRNSLKVSRELGKKSQYQLMSQEETSNGHHCKLTSNKLKNQQFPQNSGCSATDEECSSLVEDCLLTAVKVLMNLTNDNPVGCQQIAACGGLETMSSLIAGHFPSFSSPLSFSNVMKDVTSTISPENQTEIHLNDQELDFLVAILGLLVNLVEKDGDNRSRLATASVSIPNSEGSENESHRDVIPLLCSIFLANQGAGDASAEENLVPWNDEAAMLQGEKEAEKMIVEAYAALLLAFLSTESGSIRSSIAGYLPNHNLSILVPVLERFVAFHLNLKMITPETHKMVNEVIESCRMP
ncbi:hypothetical protein K2173_004332 [Erythroxylum novogranatense]|uniref:WAPL domain-containing protein n=1 Tax=Erythroxylum novogranatense TaxID=1862640 RepID=A0AAV8T483_9ROSI|nr:hypothetical protein K2173_004332 [Erythroxylum novogranatense]